MNCLRALGLLAMLLMALPGCVTLEQTPLNLAAQAGNRDQVRALLEAGANVDEPDFL